MRHRITCTRNTCNAPHLAQAISIFIALKQNKYLQSLDLSANSVGSVTAMLVLKELLSVNTALESIFLWKTELSDEGIIALAEGQY